METVLAAIITTLGAVYVTLGQRRTRRAVTDVHDEIRTNHGLRAGEYLERVAEVQISVARLRLDLADHAVTDSENFDSLRKSLNTIINQGA